LQTSIIAKVSEEERMVRFGKWGEEEEYIASLWLGMIGPTAVWRRNGF
jgi:hypothetical protein